MRIYDIIIKKRNGQPLSTGEIRYAVDGFTAGSIPDYQISALLMAIYLNGMTDRETADLTQSMVESGELADLSSIRGMKIDKHSTGGVGDKTTLIVGPIAAACGVPVAKMSGRGLGHTGGTADKLEAIPGYQISLPKERWERQVNEIGIALITSNGDFAPADKKLYALRDVTGTVESIPLIASSIMSKKLAAGCNGIVLDVKVGNGAFMKTKEEAEKLARAMVEIGSWAGKKTVALLTDMNRPLGKAVGNALEVVESVAVLQGKGDPELTNLCVELSAWMLVLGQKAASVDEARRLCREALDTGRAYEKFLQLVEAQGGDSSYIKDVERFPKATHVIPFPAPQCGYLSSIHTEGVGIASVILGAGRERKEDALDYAAGIVFGKNLGEYVEAGEPIAFLHANDSTKLQAATKRFRESITISNEKPTITPMILSILE